MKGKILETGVLQLEATTTKEKRYLKDLFKDHEVFANGMTESDGKLTLCIFKRIS